MKSIFTTVFLVFFVLALHAQKNFKAETAADYNEFFVKLQDNVFAGFQMFNDDVAVNIDSARFDLLVVNMLVSFAIDDLKTVTIYEGGKELKDAFNALFLFYDEASKNQFVEILDLIEKLELSEEDNARIAFLTEEIEQREGPLDMRVKDAQTAFAKLHGFTLGN